MAQALCSACRVPSDADRENGRRHRPVSMETGTLCTRYYGACLGQLDLNDVATPCVGLFIDPGHASHFRADPASATRLIPGNVHVLSCVECEELVLIEEIRVT